MWHCEWKDKKQSFFSFCRSNLISGRCLGCTSDSVVHAKTNSVMHVDQPQHEDQALNEAKDGDEAEDEGGRGGKFKEVYIRADGDDGADGDDYEL